MFYVVNKPFICIYARLLLKHGSHQIYNSIFILEMFRVYYDLHRKREKERSSIFDNRERSGIKTFIAK